jgi:hypothetical protein
VSTSALICHVSGLQLPRDPAFGIAPIFVRQQKPMSDVAEGLGTMKRGGISGMKGLSHVQPASLHGARILLVAAHAA